MASVSTEILDATTRAAIVELADRVQHADGAPPLSDDALSHLSSPEVTHAVARADDGAVLGYAQRRDGAAEVAAEASAIGSLLDAVARPGLLIWSHGRRSRLAPVLAARGFVQDRELYQLRRSLADLPAEPPLPPDVVVRAFRPGQDEDAWLAVNAAAFAAHREQGRRTRDELVALMAQPWFAAEDFLLAERGDALLGYHWTKMHGDGLGEVYVLGVGPDAQGLGLGNALLVRGLRHLAERGCETVLLYVDGDNSGARRLYTRGGFTEYDLDVQWRAP